MIPVELAISGFLSYREPVRIDFTAFDLACISGANGAGKSSLLDAITWVLFGQARKRDDSLVNNASPAAEVSLVFDYEGNRYRVQRSLPRGKTSRLEFLIQQACEGDSSLPGDERGSPAQQGAWKPLTESTLRETQGRIERTLRLDYDTFVNASFFLQGKADLFTQQRPADRKRILRSILGLEIWEVYRQRTVDRRRGVEAEITKIEGSLQEIHKELSEEAARKSRLEMLQTSLGQQSQVRAAQEAALDTSRKVAAALSEQRRMLESLSRQLDSARNRLDSILARLEQRERERDAIRQLLARAVEVDSAYQEWLTAREQLRTWEEIAARFYQHEARRQEPLAEINAFRTRLEQELLHLKERQQQVETAVADIPRLEDQLALTQQAIREAEKELVERSRLEGELDQARQQQAEARAENPRLKREMDELKQRIEKLAATEGAICPLCGQPLSASDRENLVAELSAKGKEMGDKFRANKALLEQADGLVSALEKQIAALAPAEAALRTHQRTADQINAKLDQVRELHAEWENQNLPRLELVTAELQGETFCPEARAKLAEIDTQLKAIGYDAAAHDAARKSEAQGRAVEEEKQALDRAQAALAPLEREIEDIKAQVNTQQGEIAHLEQEHTEAAAILAAAEAQAPDLASIEQELNNLQEQENRLLLEVGAARQSVLVLEDLKKRRKNLETSREQQARLVGQYRRLEQAFGKDGIPALLIEQALPQIERRANEVLDRLSSGGMSVRFLTQKGYRDKSRDDLRETLDISISDSAGTRDYEMFSGGEAFRVNFAIRLALSEVLAQRAGARLQTLVIDEGFGSQDAMGRQRLVEAINLVSTDFAKILVITHIEELKDAFPARIEVEKTPLGSTLHVV